MKGRVWVACALATGALVVAPAAAGAAVTIGSDLAPDAANTDSCFPSSPCTLANSAIGGTEVTSPIDGVVVRWRIRPINAAAGTPVSLEVVRAAGGGAFTAVNVSPDQTTPAVNSATTLTFATRQPIAAGDGIALDLGGFMLVTAAPAAGNTFLRWAPQLGIGESRTPSQQSSNSLELLLNADIEPDCDNDGFGDETQDQVVDCVVPETEITKGPKDKTKKKKATFEFNSSEPGVSFECSLDAGSFVPCSSPDTVKVKKGRHTFSVRARDAAGNVDASPASDDWKVKKK